MNLPRDLARKVLELAGESPPAATYRPHPSLHAVIPVRLVVGPIPVRLVSEANAHDGLKAKLGRKKAVKDAVRTALPRMAVPFTLPVVVRITRVGGKQMDGDNLARACKNVRDVVAEWLGVDDADRRVKWVTKQRAGYESGVEIDIRTREV